MLKESCKRTGKNANSCAASTPSSTNETARHQLPPDNLKIRFQADADLDEDIVTGLRRREPGIDFQTATEAGLHGLNDQEVLAHAAEESRVLASHDRKTMPHHFASTIVTFPQ